MAFNTKVLRRASIEHQIHTLINNDSSQSRLMQYLYQVLNLPLVPYSAMFSGISVSIRHMCGSLETRVKITAGNGSTGLKPLVHDRYSYPQPETIDGGAAA